MRQFLGTILERMMKAWSWVTLIVLAILIKLSSLYSGFIEQYYANAFYPAISKIQRFLFGWLPFSLGDIIYGFLSLSFFQDLADFKGVIKTEIQPRVLSQGPKQIIFFFFSCMFCFTCCGV
jgi:hypothetical protein